MFEKTTKRCKFCSMEIPKRAKVCPFCKKALKPRGCLAGIIIFIILGGFIAITFGSLSSSVSTNGMTIEIYTWYGNGVAGSNANVTFTNGSVTGKAQVGLK